MHILKLVLNFILALILAPLAFLMDVVCRFRRFAYTYGLFKVHFFQVPIISVGNLVMGGTGKTPFTLWLSNYMNSLGKKALILSRGYKGNMEHGRIFLRSGTTFAFDPSVYGDEPFMLAKEMSEGTVVVGKNRTLNLRFFFEKENPDVVILDDGHQHLKLGRRMNIVLFDALMPHSKYKVFPLGYMRENLSALRDTDIIIVGRSDQAGKKRVEELLDLLNPYRKKGSVLAQMIYQPLGFFDKNNNLLLKTKAIEGEKVICIAGIASPLSFFFLVESLGARIEKKISFPDHHYYTDKELRPIVDEAKKKKVRIIVTQKDMVKMRSLLKKDEVLYLKIEVEFISGEREIKEKLEKILGP